MRRQLTAGRARQPTIFVQEQVQGGLPPCADGTVDLGMQEVDASQAPQMPFHHPLAVKLCMQRDVQCCMQWWYDWASIRGQPQMCEEWRFKVLELAMMSEIYADSTGLRIWMRVHRLPVMRSQQYLRSQLRQGMCSECFWPPCHLCFLDFPTPRHAYFVSLTRASTHIHTQTGHTHLSLEAVDARPNLLRLDVMHSLHSTLDLCTKPSHTTSYLAISRRLCPCSGQMMVVAVQPSGWTATLDWRVISSKDLSCPASCSSPAHARQHQHTLAAETRYSQAVHALPWKWSP